MPCGTADIRKPIEWTWFEQFSNQELDLCQYQAIRSDSIQILKFRSRPEIRHRVHFISILFRSFRFPFQLDSKAIEVYPAAIKLSERIREAHAPPTTPLIGTLSNQMHWSLWPRPSNGRHLESSGLQAWPALTCESIASEVQSYQNGLSHLEGTLQKILSFWISPLLPFTWPQSILHLVRSSPVESLH